VVRHDDTAHHDRFWAERARKDPLGRSPDDLRAAWETREPVTMDRSVFAELDPERSLTLPDTLSLQLAPPRRTAGDVPDPTSEEAAR
jgi:hypothetical protein